MEAEAEVSQSATPSSQTQFVREAPGIEERKIELMDIARQVAQKPINLPNYQVAGLGALEQQGITFSRDNRCWSSELFSKVLIKLQAAAAPVWSTTNKSIFKSISKLCN